jgi:hypothetical protein
VLARPLVSTTLIAHLHHRPRARRARSGRERLPRGHLQRGLSQHLPGRSRSQAPVHPIFVPRSRHVAPETPGSIHRTERNGVANARRRSGIVEGGSVCVREAIAEFAAFRLINGRLIRIRSTHWRRIPATANRERAGILVSGSRQWGLNHTPDSSRFNK